MRPETTLILLGALAGAVLHAQPPAGPAPSSPPAAPLAQPMPEPPPPPVGEPPDDPWLAYEAGFFDRAVQGFTDLQVERPEDPEVQLNLGSASYQMRDYGEADRAFATAAQSADPAVRAQALYGLGNSAYRQGRLGEAVELFRSVLEIDPDDEDAKFNLEFVRDEIRRRHEENQKRQEEQQQQNQDQEQPQEDQPQEQGQQEQDQDQQGEGQPAPDADQDGLPDQVEREGRNPTDPNNPDTDGDSLPDGQEDRNRNGQVDEGETDPNRMDTDGDGIPDGAEQEPQGGGQPEESEVPPEGLTPEEAERYLQALGEDRPPMRRHPEGKRTRRVKDW